jgi:sec-independent protein translocase protein TatA
MPTHTLAFGIGPWELGIVLLIVVLILGAGMRPGVGADRGKSLNAFKKNAALGEGEDEDKDKNKDSTKKALKDNKTADAKPIDTTETDTSTD